MGKAIFEILRTGTHRARNGRFTFSQEDIKGIAKFYSADVKKAPLVIGHPENDNPQYGNVTKLYHHEGHLFAEAEINEELISKVKNGEISGISSAVYFSESKGNPVKGLGSYLKHVGFLEKGKDEPAVKGMLNPEISLHIANLSADNDIVFLSDGGYSYNRPNRRIKSKSTVFPKRPRRRLWHGVRYYQSIGTNSDQRFR